MLTHRSGRCVLGVTLLLWVSGCEKDDGPVCDRLAPRLQHALEEAASAGDLPGVTASLRLQDCTWRGAAGVSRMEPSTGLKAEDRLRVGSITKTFTSVVVLQLQAEGKLSLDAPLATWAPDFPRADRITVRQLLNHTSGAFNYTQSQDFLAQAEANPGKTWTAEELIALGAAKSPAFEPGTRWDYSNTNYILLGHILESVTGTPLAQQIRTRILEPLELGSTGLDGAEPLPPLAVRGYSRDPRDGSWMDFTDFIHPSAAGAAGALVSSADDLSAFYQALFERSLLAPVQLAEMTDWVATPIPDMPGYGLGLVRAVTPVGPGHGHDGEIPGFSALAFYLPERKASLAVLTNRERAAVSGVTQKLLEVLATE
ncbi:serine hydrolase domain-containing protein [Corallococcus aberystwythensis]|uniref:Class A beta-lactamase-related serine hydrolase n=1 Tax=Corallococcus aberystwythensis TaxID=2316722 RepID=A0A3A8R2Q4_9BACT|nr:serine hydrolase domain-containing protein [Corallococcus aberystwythensis]RKH74351.1 class A beta-lactamase-related serine hydrolase [Corallococcus aberystwythensis]